MHLTVGYFVLYTPIYRLTERKRFPCTKLSMQNGGCENRLCALASRVRQGSCRIWLESIPCWLSIRKNPIKYGEKKHNRMRTSLFMHTKTPSVTIQGNITAMRYRKDVIPSVLFLHIRVNLSMMLARDYTSCHVDRSKLVMLVANNVQTLWWPAKAWVFKKKS